MADIRAIAVEATRRQGLTDAQSLAAQAVAGEISDEELLERRDRVPTWRARDFSGVPVGTPYKWGDMVYKLVQPHDASGNESRTPDAVPALWAAVSKPGETGSMDNPITAARGMEYTYGLYYLDPEDSKIYLCKRTGEAEGGKIVLQFLPHELLAQYFEAPEVTV